MCNVLVADRRGVRPSAGKREHAATDWSWRGWGPARPLADREGVARRWRRQGRSSGGALHLDCAARRARLRSDQGLGGLSGQVTDHASVDDV
jgi:hypothetical protein